MGDFAKKYFKGILVSLDIIAAFIAIVVAAVLKFDAIKRLPLWFTEYLWLVVLIDVVLTIGIFAFK